MTAWSARQNTTKDQKRFLQQAQHVISRKAATSSLVVVGAHHFAADPNDPLRSIILKQAWASVLLIEASPHIANALRESISTRSPLPFVTAERIHVSNTGIVPKAMLQEQASNLSFYSFTANGSGLPYYATQIGGFSRWHVYRHFPWFVRVSRGRWSRSQLIKSVVRSNVQCLTLSDAIRRHALPRPAVILIDVEGFDCRIVEEHNWCAAPFYRPDLLVFEHKHCKDKTYRSAIHNLSKCPAYGKRPSLVTSENAFYLADVGSQMLRTDG